MMCCLLLYFIFFFKQKTAYEMRISDWSSDVCSSHASALAFAGAMGFLWLGTVPLTSGIVGRIFGIRYLSMLYGIVFLSHQLGSFFGAWMAGLIFDSTGSYNIAWGFSIALGLFAGLVHLRSEEHTSELTSI